MNKLEKEGLSDFLEVQDPSTIEELISTHTQAYIETIRDFGEGYLDANSIINSNTYPLSLLSASGVTKAAEFAVHQNKPTLALTRPPGHHAGKDFGGGFCYFNNVGVAARHLQKKMGLKKIAIVDLDVHHGNGTEDIFLADPSVLYCSIHEWGIFPGTGPLTQTGVDEGEGFTLNIPLSQRCGDETYHLAYRELLMPILRQFEPDAILVSLGVDAHYKDEISSLTMSSLGYLKMCANILELARDICNSRITFALEGGYHLNALSEVIAGVASLMVGKKLHMQYNDIWDNDEGWGYSEIDNCLVVQRKHWDL